MLVPSCFLRSDCFGLLSRYRCSSFLTLFPRVNPSHCAHTVLTRFLPTPSCPYFSLFYPIVILALACISFVPPSPHTCVHISNRFSPKRLIGHRHLSQTCHVLNPMRRLSRIPTVFSRPPPHHPCIIFRRLSSAETANVNGRLSLPVTGHIPRFDWRLRVPSPKPPLNTVIKVLERRTQPPPPTDAYPYNAHIQKYKDQFVTHCSSPANLLLTPVLQFPLPLIFRACAKRGRR